MSNVISSENDMYELISIFKLFFNILTYVVLDDWIIVQMMWYLKIFSYGRAKAKLGHSPARPLPNEKMIFYLILLEFGFHASV